MAQANKRKALQLLFLAAVSVVLMFPGCSFSSFGSEDEIRSLQNEVSSLKSDITSLQKDVSDLQSKNSSLESQLKTVENNVNTLGYKVRP
jgi:septal ring factor EnvC (AmiA/AmiB activator)